MESKPSWAVALTATLVREPPSFRSCSRPRRHRQDRQFCPECGPAALRDLRPPSGRSGGVQRSAQPDQHRLHPPAPKGARVIGNERRLPGPAAGPGTGNGPDRAGSHAYHPKNPGRGSGHGRRERPGRDDDRAVVAVGMRSERGRTRVCRHCSAHGSVAPSDRPTCRETASSSNSVSPRLQAPQVKPMHCWRRSSPTPRSQPAVAAASASAGGEA